MLLFIASQDWILDGESDPGFHGLLPGISDSIVQNSNR